MAKCERCGKKLFIGKIKLKNAVLCYDCTEALGWKPATTYMFMMNNYTWEDVKDGNDAMIERNRKNSEEFRRNNPGLCRVINEMGSDEATSDEDEEI